MKVKAIPKGYHSLTVDLVVNDGTKAIDFYKKVFGATELGKPFTSPDGKIAHAELKIGDTRIMLVDESMGMGALSPKSVGGTPVILYLYVEDVDKQIKQAITSGSKLLRPAENHFYGDRSGQIEDPFGHLWVIATHVEDVSKEEMKKRAAAMFKSMTAGSNR